MLNFHAALTKDLYLENMNINFTYLYIVFYLKE